MLSLQQPRSTISLFVKGNCLLNFSMQVKWGLYNRGYLAALRFLRSCRKIRRLPRSKNNKIILNLIFESRSSYFAASPGIFHLFLHPGYKTTAIQKLNYKKYFVFIFISRLVFRGCQETLFRAYIMAPQQVEIRQPRRRDTHAIVRSRLNATKIVTINFSNSATCSKENRALTFNVFIVF